ncbi:murein L,D-transpeptidase YcbB/YkuD [Desulfuromonas soudanensis]|uniref:Murein L,D-transpeptidase YcbB/YkuD n=1 Tax=Desulfuromonas soudanensis TaxID=1603606 RepID=A0A0M4DFE6_9BACT|nr:L,D-transpeptidase family protein [Desulfuromonas soudanensis]ALC15220.1 murein L,D-transpeptidase YcbB/YkuD [Desulfuromonas soudanensis]
MGRYRAAIAGFILALATVVATATASDRSMNAALGLALQERFPLPFTVAANPSLPDAALQQFYFDRDDDPAWFTPAGLVPEAAILTERLSAAAEEGLCPDAYFLAEIEELREYAAETQSHRLIEDQRRLARLDLRLSEAFLTYAAHLIHGRVDPATVHRDWHANLRQVDLAGLLEFALAEGRMKTILDDLVPPHPGYRDLRRALADYRRISALGGWETLPGSVTLRPGDFDPRVPALRRRLAHSGDLGEGAGAETLYDAETAANLRNFQRRHGLSADGVLGPSTLEELNRPVEERIRQLEVNLERWRWLPKTLGERYIQVNIADLALSAVDKGQTVLTLPVVVGNAYRKTPVFSASLQYLVFAPYWFVPPTIFKVDKLPRLRADPDYLEKHHFEVVAADRRQALLPLEGINWKEVRAESFPGLLRQSPGPWNPLGRVKFIFPNPFAIYLHDTPDRHLFASERRAFSSGCIRVERPLELARLLLQDQRQGDPRRLLAAMEAEEPQRIDLLRPWPIHILYFTAWSDEEGEVNFRRDLYWRDLALEEALTTATAPRMAPAPPLAGLPESPPQPPTFFQVEH